MSRTDRGLPSLLLSSSAGILGGGAGGGAARMFSSRYFPRIVGAVRVEYDVTERTAAVPSRPKRFSSVSVTGRKWLPYTSGTPYCRDSCPLRSLRRAAA